MNEYKEGRGDYYLAAGKREEKAAIDKSDPVAALRDAMALGGQTDE